MTTYAGVEFTVIEPSAMLPRWKRAARISRLEPIGVNYDVLQFGGLGNRQLALTIRLDHDADLETLYAAIGTMARTLEDLWDVGDDYTNVMLIAVDNPRRHISQEVLLVDVTFEKAN